MRACHIVATGLVVLVAAAVAAPIHAETQKTYFIIEATLTTKQADGRESVICNPRLMTLEGHEGYIHIGETLRAPKNVEVQEPLRSGTHGLFKVFRKDGQLFLDATVSRSLGHGDDVGVHLTTTSLRIVEAITPGKKISEVTPEGGRWELLVRECGPGTTKGESSNSENIHAAAAPNHVQTPAANATLPHPVVIPSQRED